MFFLVTLANMTIKEVLDLDVLTFNAYVAAVHRVRTADRIAESYLTHVASQGKTSELRKFVNQLSEDVGISRQERAADLSKLRHLVKNVMKGKGL